MEKKQRAQPVIIPQDSFLARVATPPAQEDMKFTTLTWVRSSRNPEVERAPETHEMRQNQWPIIESSRVSGGPHRPGPFASRNINPIGITMTGMAIFMATIVVSTLIASIANLKFVFAVNFLAIVPLAVALHFTTKKFVFSLGLIVGTFFWSLVFGIVFAPAISDPRGFSLGKAPTTTMTTALHSADMNSFLYIVCGIIGRREILLACVLLVWLAAIWTAHTVLDILSRHSPNIKRYIPCIYKHQEAHEVTHDEARHMEYLDGIIGYRKPEGVASNDILGSYRTTCTVLCEPDTVCACDEPDQGTKISFAYTHLVLFFVTAFFLPLTSAAFTLSSSYRILAGVGASGTAVAVIPLRTLPEVANKVWIVTYTVWAIFFSAYLGMQIMLIPSELSYRRKWFLSCVIVAAVHFSIGLAQTSTTLADAFTIFGPLIATISTYVVSLVFNGGESDADANTRHEGIAMVRTTFCG